MNLTEPQAGSDLGALATRAERARRRHLPPLRPEDLHHLRRARPRRRTSSTSCSRACRMRRPASRGISLFLVPKFLVDGDGTPGARNDVFCAGIEHKLGIHGSPTCTMIYGDGRSARAGAVGWLVGEENRGLACMFTMMNNARLTVGIQGVGHRRARAAAGARPTRASAGRGARPGCERRGHEPDRRASGRRAACC